MSVAPPPRLLRALQRIGEAVNDRGCPWAVVGGLAVSIRVEPRFTRDVDVVVAVADDDAAEALVADLQQRGFTIQLVLEQAALGRLATVRLLAPGESDAGIVVDLLFASSGIESEICAAAEPVEVTPQFTVPVATVGHLVAMKALSVSPSRLQDEIDLQGLIANLTPVERQRALDAATRIEAVGANRGRALRADLERRLPAP